jgi:hypothetical protein
MAFQNYYYSGQGSLYMAPRTLLGKPAGLFQVGNVPDLTIDIATTVFEHKESQSGDRLIDLSINKENKSTFAFKLESLSLDNLAMGLYGTKTTINGASVVDEEVILYSSKSATLAYPDVSAVTVSAKDGLVATAWVADTVTVLGAYKIPTVANSHYYKATAVAGDTKTAPAVQPTWPVNGGVVVDDQVTWTDMGLINQTPDVDFILAAKFGMITPTQPLAAGVGIEEGRPYLIDYTYATTGRVDVFTVPAPERYLRFEGLNTVDGSHVIVDIFKAKFDPLSGYPLINEDLASASMKGTILFDSLQLTGSNYFRQWNVAA